MPFSESRCTIIAVDVADWTNARRTRAHRVEAHRGLYRILETAFNDTGIDWSECHREDRGDGVFLLVPARYSCLKLADQLTDRLFAELLRYNEIHTAEAAIQLRFALNFGAVEHTENGKVGEAIDNTFRLLDAHVAKTRLRESHGVLAVITSDLIYQDSIKGDPVTSPHFTPIHVAVKQFDGDAWLRLYGVRQQEVADVLPSDEFAELRTLLRDVEIKRLPELVARATGTSLPPTGITDLAAAVGYVGDHNAGPDGIPPILRFVELLVRAVDAELGVRLAEWNLRQAERLGLGRKLAELRATPRPAGQPRLHLVVLVEHQLLDAGRYAVSYWRQDDPTAWPPPLGGRFTVAAEKVEQAIDTLVKSAEVAWSGYRDDPAGPAVAAAHRGPVALEFILPRALLNLPVDTYRKELDSPEPQPLTLDYSVVIRSLERMRTRYWHRPWFLRWDTMMGATAGSDPARVYFPPSDENDSPYGVDVDLKNDPQWVAMVLSAAPEADALPGDQLTSALRAGLPVILWTRAESSRDALSNAVTRLADSRRVNLSDLPAELRGVRQQALVRRIDQGLDADIISNMVLLWDDARRLVNVDRPRSTAPGDRGGTA